MTSTIVCRALLLLATLVSLQSCYGWLPQKNILSRSSFRSCRDKRLRCVNTPDSTIPASGDKRSKMNQKMLERAKQLREEAVELEAANKISEKIPEIIPVVIPEFLPQDVFERVTEEVTAKVVIVEESLTSKLIGEEFVSRFPVERMTLNTPIFTLGAFNSNVTVSELTNSSVYVSVLADRNIDKAKQKEQLDKISGEAVREKNIEKAVSEAKVSDTYLRGLLRDCAIPGNSNDTIYPDMSDIRTISSPATNLEDLDKALKVTKNGGKVQYELMSIDQYIDANVGNWYRRAVSKFLLGNVLNSDSDTENEDDMDIKLYKMAFATAWVDLVENEKYTVETITDWLTYVISPTGNVDREVKITYRADYLKYKITGEIPSLSDLMEKESKDSRTGEEVDGNKIHFWRLDTIKRLVGADLMSVEERESLWRMNPELIAQYEKSEESKVTLLKKIINTDEKISTLFQRLLQRAIDGDVGDDTKIAWKELQEIVKARRELNIPPPANLLTIFKITDLSDDNVKRFFELSKNNKDGVAVISAAEMKDMSNEDVQSNMSQMSDEELPEFLEKFFKANVVSEEFGSTSAERFVIEYFDVKSRMEGKVLSREGAGRFQVEMLKDLFVVSSVKMCQGAVIFDGRFKAKNSGEFVKQLEARYCDSKMSEEVGYTLIMNEKNVDMEGGIQQAALDQMLGRSPAVIVYPKEWNSTTVATADESFVKIFKSTISTLATVSSAAFAANCLDMFNPQSNFMLTGIIPDDFLPLSFMPLTIMYTSILVETVVAKFKGFNAQAIVVPSISLFNFGFRSLYTTMPKNRNDIFDTAAIGLSVSLLYSLGVLFAGLQLTASAASDTVAGYPSVSLALLNTNAVVSQLLNYILPQTEQIAAASTTVATVTAAAGGVASGIAAIDPTVHLHWLAIAGAVSFIGATLQLIPLDNSVGSKLGQAVAGADGFALVSVFFTLFKFFVIFPMLFSINTVGIGSKLVFDYFVTSQVVGNQKDNILPVDNLTDVSEGRRIVFLGLACLFFFSVVPYEDALVKLSHSLSSVVEYVSVIATTGAVPVQNNIFP